MKKTTLNKVSALGVVAAVFTVVLFSNPLRSLEQAGATYGYWYGYGSSPNSSNFKVPDDCRVGWCNDNKWSNSGGSNSNTNTNKKEEPKKEDKPLVGAPIEKEINGKKYSYMNGSNVLITKVLADLAGFTTKFNDISTSPAKEDIMRLEKAGIVKGTTPTTYEPNRAITRAEFLAIVMGAYGYDLYQPAKALPFSDVDASSWQARVISAALENNITAGDTNAAGSRVFRPNSQISKIEALAIVYKLSGITVPTTEFKHSFTDAAADWQNAILSNAEYLEVISVPADKKFNPNAGYSRADMASLVIKFAKLY